MSVSLEYVSLLLLDTEMSPGGSEESLSSMYGTSSGGPSESLSSPNSCFSCSGVRSSFASGVAFGAGDGGFADLAAGAGAGVGGDGGGDGVDGGDGGGNLSLSSRFFGP